MATLLGSGFGFCCFDLVFLSLNFAVSFYLEFDFEFEFDFGLEFSILLVL